MSYFKNEKELEYWMRPFTGRVMLPGQRSVLHTDTRLFFILLWQLLCMGYSEVQLAEYALETRWSRTPPLPEALALAEAVYTLAEKQNLAPTEDFRTFLTPKDHPRHIVDDYK